MPVTLGVGDGNGQLFVHVDCDSIKTVQTKLLELEAVRRLPTTSINHQSHT